MMRRIFMASVLFLTIAVAPPASGGDIEDLIKLSGLAEMIAFDIRENRQQLLLQCSASSWCQLFLGEVADAVREADKNPSLGPVVVPLIEELFSQLEERDRHGLLEFYRSALGERIVELDRASRGPEQIRDVEENGEAIISRQGFDRRELIDAIDSHSNGSSLQRLLDGQARQIVEWTESHAKRHDLAAAPAVTKLPERSIHSYSLRLFLAYEPLSDEQLATYLEFLESDAGESWMRTLLDIRRRAVQEASKPIMVRVVKRLGGV